MAAQHATTSNQLNEALATVLTSDLLSQVRDSLVNWGAWYRKENVYELRLLTGVTNQSVLYRLMRSRGTRAGYRSHGPMVNDADGQAMHHRLQSDIITRREYTALFSFYVHGNGGAPADVAARGRAVKKLAGIKQAGTEKPV